VPESSPSDDLQNDLQKLLAKSRKLRAQADELDVEIERVSKLIQKSRGDEANELVMGSLLGDVALPVEAVREGSPVEEGPRAAGGTTAIEAAREGGPISEEMQREALETRERSIERTARELSEGSRDETGV
jgi:hypothetical protein